MSMQKDGFNHPRMKTYMTAADMNTEGCLQLAETILEEAAQEYLHARRAVVAHPNSKDAQEHFKTCQAFYRSDWFAALSGGVMDGETVMRRLNKEAVRGWRVRATAT
jgi:hypothetical protein